MDVNKKSKENIEAKLKVEKAKMENIEHFHPFVKEMSDEDLNTCYMYFEAKSLVKMAEEKIEEFNKNEKELNEELLEIYKQIPQLGTKAHDFTEN